MLLIALCLVPEKNEEFIELIALNQYFAPHLVQISSHPSIGEVQLGMREDRPCRFGAKKPLKTSHTAPCIALIIETKRHMRNISCYDICEPRGLCQATFVLFEHGFKNSEKLQQSKWLLWSQSQIRDSYIGEILYNIKSNWELELILI